jgi:general secretion pathway protein G
LKDAWSNDYRYTATGSKYTITSLGNDGKDGGTGSDADITVNN